MVEYRFVDVCECLVGIVEDLCKGLPAGPALALAPVVPVNGNVIHKFVAGIVARERGAFAVVRDLTFFTFSSRKIRIIGDVPFCVHTNSKSRFNRSKLGSD